MKVFLDTNIVFGAIISPKGLCSKVIEKAVKEHTIAVSRDVASELRSILTRKTKRTPEEIEGAITAYLALGDITTKRKKHKVKIRDPDDQVILERALGEGVEVLITGDNDLLTVQEEVEELKIIHPKDFLHHF